MSFLALPCTFVIILRLCSFLSLPRPPDAVFYNSIRPYILPPFFPCSWHLSLHHLCPRLPSVEVCVPLRVQFVYTQAHCDISISGPPLSRGAWFSSVNLAIVRMYSTT
ncbi:hypothetical protein JB92DRAFT_406864 [Gautieria morchelliformis]|nr:hypothetical protein JB92DRAFT_406864 [Gautieria morchelliformis]